ncbi:MAG: RecX family transcriptional regulator [Nitrospirota bacterium]
MTDSGDDARKYAFKLLSYRGRSENELRERLAKKGFPEKAVDHALKNLKEAGYIDDAALALNLKRQALNNRLLGYNGAKLLMLKRGLSIQTVESALGFDEDLEIRNAKKLLGKKLKSAGNDLSVSERRRLWNFLARRGYSFSTIEKSLRNFNLKREDEE